MTVENVTEQYDDYETYSVYDGHEFYRVEVAWQQGNIDRFVSFKDYEGANVKDETLKQELIRGIKEYEKAN